MSDFDHIDPEVLATPEGRLMVRRSFMRYSMAGAAAAAFATMRARSAQAATSTATPTATPSGTPTGTASGAPGGASETLTEFVGLTTDGTVIDDLYTIHSTGVSTQPVVTAAAAFLASLSTTQRAATVFDIDPTDYTKDEFRLWSNVDGYVRQGVKLGDLTAAQASAGLALLGAGLSAKGLVLSENIRRINGIAGKAINLTDRFNDGLYYFTIMGTPSTTDPWGWQFEGHHQVINYFVLGDQVVMTPTFLGSEPTVAASDAYGTISILDEEMEAAIAAINSLTTAQQATAILGAKTGDDNKAEAFEDNVQVPYAGIAVSTLSTAAQDALWELVWLFVFNQRADHAAVWFADIKAHVADTHFAWKGATDANAVFWCRIQSPVFYLEFDCELPGPVGQGYGDPQVPSRRHIHTIMRTPNGNDYGKALLALHYLTAEHHN